MSIVLDSTRRLDPKHLDWLIITVTLGAQMKRKNLDQLGMPFPYTVGPMVGLSHLAFRELIRSYCPANIKVPLFSEMLSSLRLPSERPDLAEELFTSDKDYKSWIPQVLGNDEWYLERSIRKLEQLHPWGIDINMGCPVKRTLRHNWGVKLMGDPQYAFDVVQTVRRHYSGPLSVKMRCGIKKADPQFIVNFTDALEEAGADWISIHARLQSEKHRGAAHWDLLSHVKEKRRIPVVANGDIQTANDAIKLVTDMGLDGAMIGRAATARPWIFWQIADQLGLDWEAPVGMEGQKPPMGPEEEGLAYIEASLRFIGLLKKHFTNETKTLRKFRFYIAHSHRWLMFGHSFYSRTMKCKSLPEIEDMIQDFKDRTRSFPMSARINLL